MITKLEELYNQWRVNANEFESEEGIKAWDCGEQSCWQSFCEFVGKDVSFEEMLELEEAWNQKNL